MCPDTRAVRGCLDQCRLQNRVRRCAADIVAVCGVDVWALPSSKSHRCVARDDQGVVMDFDVNEADERLRSRIQTFLEEKWLPLRGDHKGLAVGREAFALAAQLLSGTGWLTPAWPADCGGADLPAAQRYIVEEELVKADFPPRDRIAVELAGPAICKFGSAEQKRRYLPRIIAGDDVWCQGFSEPNSGSDINSLRCTATRLDDHYVVEGLKIWISNAHFADMMFTLVRTAEPGKSPRGLTLLLIDLKAPGIRIRPIMTIDAGHHFNEVTLDKVRVPVSNVVGEPGLGWHNARFILSNERILLSQAPQTRRRVDCLKRNASRSDALGRHLDRELAQLDVDLCALEFAVLRVLQTAEGDALTDGLICALKLRGSQLRQRVGELEMEALGHRALADAVPPEHIDRSPNRIERRPPAHEFLFDRAASIAGGTSEIQRNLIAAVALDL